MALRSPAAILFVDDNDDVRVSTAEILRLAGFEVWEASDGAQALRLVCRHPDLIILDVGLPDLSGFEVCRRIRARPDTASIPLLHLSGVAGSSEDRTQGLEGGADGYLVKPVDPAELVAHVRALLRLSRAEESLRESEDRYRLIAENASAAVLMLDERGTILFANRAVGRVFGYAPGELLERDVSLLMAHPLRGRHLEAFTHYLRTGRPTILTEGVEVRGLHKGGREVDLEVSFGEFRDREGSRRFVGIVLDISARKDAEKSLAALSRKMLEVQEAERRHIAHELHDEVGQALSALKITLHGLQRGPAATPPDPLLIGAVGLVDRIIAQVRTLSLELRPPMMDDLGLVAALRWHVKSLQERSGLRVLLRDDTTPERPPGDIEMACFRIVQEALNNAVKHARARIASVELWHQEGALLLVVRDDGTGFDVGAARKRSARGTGFGLLGMEERVRLLGGRLVIESATGEGSEVRARFPLDPTATGEGRA